MKINSKLFHKIVKHNISGQLTNFGYIKTKGAMAGGCKPMNDKFFLFWFQCDKWGWEDNWGSSFTIEFQLSNSDEIAGGSLLQRGRLPTYLSDSELEVMRHKNNEVIKTTIGFKQQLQVVTEADGERIVALGKEPSDKPYNSNLDPWFHYYLEDDIHFWSTFFLERLPGIELAIIGAG
ncbi:hypothetical protein [Halioxenophilus sp. WMMB6]|uniref:hypothetical protein n=1 Tax=Halioxenophilus sp. WMMB6 TaxID=3073815 RepID=UPI00295F3EF6|nr:hypothetical protein [Halioxenophilus sp. WMMB6]